jgi:hypothetical protein
LEHISRIPDCQRRIANNLTKTGTIKALGIIGITRIHKRKARFGKRIIDYLYS